MLTDHARLGAVEFARLARVVADQTSLERVLRWAESLSPPRRIERIVTQDEFTHDVIIPIARSRFLVYDVT